MKTLNNEQTLLVETLIRDAVDNFKRMLPQMVFLAAKQKAELREVVTLSNVKGVIKSVAKPVSGTKPHTTSGKLDKFRKSGGRNFDKVMVNGIRMSKNRAAWHALKFLLTKSNKKNHLTPEKIEKLFPGIKVYPTLAQWVDLIPPNFTKRYYTEDKLLLTGDNGRKLAISNQWNSEEYHKLETVAKLHGMNIEAAVK